MVARVKREEPKANGHEFVDKSASGNGLRPGHRKSVGNRGPMFKRAEKRIHAILADVLSRECKRVKGKTNAYVICEKMVEQAVGGDLGFIKEVWDRHVGKPVAPVEVSGPNKGPVETIHSDHSDEMASQLYQDTLNGVEYDRLDE